MLSKCVTLTLHAGGALPLELAVGSVSLSRRAGKSRRVYGAPEGAACVAPRVKPARISDAHRRTCALAYIFQRQASAIGYPEQWGTPLTADQSAIRFTNGSHVPVPLTVALHKFGDGTACDAKARRLPLLRAMESSLLRGVTQASAWVAAGAAPARRAHVAPRPSRPAPPRHCKMTPAETKALKKGERKARAQACAVEEASANVERSRACADLMVNTVREWARRSWREVMVYKPSLE
jgi:hypothetical protein